ncbi:MAG: DUF4244 domain-containing protein [Actinomycetota bacterium]|nr:DUF4244 domain-containing protein [Actinomycetota bacterium]
MRAREVNSGAPEQDDDLAVKVREIFPGAANRAPYRPPSNARRRWPAGSELGMATAEYAIATLAAVGFAGLLVVILKSDEVRGFLLGIIRSALSLP